MPFRSRNMRTRSPLPPSPPHGIFNFFKGVISQKWMQVQRKYCSLQNIQFRTTWSTKLITLLLRHTHLMWTTRCKIIHLSNVGTFEATFRQTAYSLLLRLKADPTQLSYSHRSLLRRNKQFFFNASIPTVRMWHKRTNTALTFNKTRVQQLGADIRNWVLVRPRDPGRTTRGARVPSRRRLFRFH